MLCCKIVALSTATIDFLWLSGYLQDMQYRKNCRGGQASGHPLQQTSSAPPFQLKWCRQYPFLNYLWQQIHADGLPCAPTPALDRDILHLADTVSKI